MKPILFVLALSGVVLAAREFPDPSTNPNSIVALQARAYSGSAITLEWRLTDGVNYRQWVASYKSDGIKILALLTIPKAKAPKTKLTIEATEDPGHSKEATLAALTSAKPPDVIFCMGDLILIGVMKAIHQLKLKVGYGLTGALPIERYESRAGYVIGRDSSIISQRNPSTNLTWEKKGELNVGIDFLTLNSRLSGSFDFFNRNITDLLYRYNVPPGIFEFPNLLVNAGELNTKGFDFNVAYDILQGKEKGLNWKTSFVLSNFSTKLVSLTTKDKLLSIGGRFATANAGSPGQNQTPYTLVEEGSSLGNFWGFQYVGADATKGILIKNAKGESIKIADGTDEDKVLLGSGLPKFIMGLTNTFNYGNLDFTFFLRGVFGHKIVNEYRVFYENANGGQLKSYNRVLTKYWDANIKDGAYNSYHVEKGDFIRLDNFTLGYTIPMSTEGTFKKARIFLSGNNVATFTGYTGINPEVRFVDGNANDGTGNAFAPGIERRTNYFTTRSFTLGANFGF